MASILSDQPSSSWWAHVEQSYTQLQELLKPGITAPSTHSQYRSRSKAQDEDGTQTPASSALSNLTKSAQLEQLEHEERYMQRVRDRVLPWVVILKAGTFQLGITAKGEALDVVVLGTGSFSRWVEVLWEGVRNAQAKAQEHDPGGEGRSEGEAMDVKLHEIESYQEQWVRLSVRGSEFVVRYEEAEEVVRRFPTASGVLTIPTSFFNDSADLCDEDVRDVIHSLQRNQIHLDKNHHLAYHYIRAWGIAKGLFNVKDESLKGFTYQDYVRFCKTQPEDYTVGVSDIVHRFFHHMDIRLNIPENSTEEDLERVLIAAQNEPFHMNMLGFPYLMQVFMIYSGSSKLKAGKWVSLVGRRVDALKDRFRIISTPVRIWPQRLIRSEASVDDETYEGCIMLGIMCVEADIPAVKDICERWKTQVDQDAPAPGECFVYVTVDDRESMIERNDLKPCTRIWPRSILKDEDRNSNQESDPDAIVKKRKPIHKSLEKQPHHPQAQMQVVENESNKTDSKGARLRPASEVLSRLRYERQHSIDDCIVGYRDRHLSKMQEKPAADWILETTHEEFIPQHRIEFVKKSGEIIWDRKAKIDKLFKSGVCD